MKKTSIDDYDYDLPKELIAQEQIKPRTHSRLMVLKNNKIIHDRFCNIINYLKKDDILVINETKVLRIKLSGKKETGGKISLMLVLKKDNHTAECVFKGNLKQGNLLYFSKGIKGEITKRKENKVEVKFNKSINHIIKTIGKLPLPPYIKKDLKNEEDYQTVYAKKLGSFASPTAGLHFDKKLLKKIKNKGIKIAKICLHVSFDTFLPIKEKDFTKHKMHGEYCFINKKNAEIINKAKRLFVVGTTTLRTLETMTHKGKVKPGKKFTTLFIYPGYKFKLKYKGLITNFHLPKSTLLLLVSAFYGREKILRAYKEAIKHKYRFYSLGDAMLLVK